MFHCCIFHSFLAAKVDEKQILYQKFVTYRILMTDCLIPANSKLALKVKQSHDEENISICMGRKKKNAEIKSKKWIWYCVQTYLRT